MTRQSESTKTEHPLGNYSMNHEGHWCWWCGNHSLNDTCKRCGLTEAEALAKYKGQQQNQESIEI